MSDAAVQAISAMVGGDPTPGMERKR
jgi:hypothetical protein